MCILVYYSAGRYAPPETGVYVLFIASLVFYGYWNWRYLPLLLGSITFNYFMGRAILRTRSKRLLSLGIVVNVLVLGYYKYALFAAENLQSVFGIDLHLGKIVLPIGISFFTFTQIAFLCDAYDNDVSSLNVSRYGLFVSFFPHCIAGPILHHKSM